MDCLLGVILRVKCEGVVSRLALIESESSVRRIVNSLFHNLDTRSREQPRDLLKTIVNTCLIEMQPQFQLCVTMKVLKSILMITDLLS